FGVEGFSESLSKEVAPLGIKVRSSNRVAFEPILRVPPQSFAKGGRSTTGRSALQSAFSETTMVSNRGIAAKLPPLLSESRRWPIHRCGSCLEVMPIPPPRSTLTKFLHPTGSGKI